MKTSLKNLAENAAIAVVLLLAGCFPDTRPNYPSRQEVIEAAAACGIEDFEPTRVGAGIAAYVDPAVENAKEKEDCIYDTLHGQGFIVTR